MEKNLYYISGQLTETIATFAYAKRSNDSSNEESVTK